MEKNFCPLCKENLTNIDDNLHKLFGNHVIDGVSWRPVEGHDLFEIHERSLVLLKELDNKNKEILRLKDKESKRLWSRIKRLFIARLVIK